MSTPMRAGPSQQGRTPSQQGRTPSQWAGAAPTPPVSTPFSNAHAAAVFSPPPGSRASPQQAKKSPATPFTLKGLPDAGAPINFDSPSTTAALGALAGNMDLGLDPLGMNALGLGRADDDDRKKRMEALLAQLRAAGKGKVSNEGLERLSVTIGLDHHASDNPTGGPLSKSVLIAGTQMALDIIINNHMVESVALSLLQSPPAIQQHWAKAGDILLRDLQLAPNQSPLTKTLEKFRANIERLAALDKLSILPALDCYEAVAGIYTSLLKVHNWDMQKLREDPQMQGKPDKALRAAALCTKHGLPAMHSRERIGLSLDYWMEHRGLVPAALDSDEIETWSILVDCAPIRREELQYLSLVPVRVSNNWISDAAEKTKPTSDDELLQSGPVLDWLEPDSTFLPASHDQKPEPGLGADPTASLPKLPNVVFMATFEPPIIVPTAVANQIYQITKSNPPDPNAPQFTFDALLFPIAPGVPYDPSDSRKITRIQPVMSIPAVPKAEEIKDNLKLHKNTLYIDRPIYGQTLTKVPFCHPRQLVEMLPAVRQYAFLSKLLANSFKPKHKKYPEPEQEKPGSDTSTTVMGDFAALMSGPAGTETRAEGPIKVEVSLIAHPVPRLDVRFPLKNGTAIVKLEIRVGGKVHISSANDLLSLDQDGDEPMTGGHASSATSSAGAGRGRRFTKADWEHKLEVCEDIGVWCELIRYKLG